ncbi:MAG: malate synthase A, partial [Deltaproteobacteria bacterium]|nr:malate synthase A [Deltaproteobacteria bacterium]
MSMRSEHHDLVLLGHAHPADATILTHGALALVAALNRRFKLRRNQLLAARVDRQARFDRGERPAFLPETEHIRLADWKVAPIPADLQDRRVEITGPVDRKMIINALNSGAKVFMADFEDSNAPTWLNQIEGQQNLYDAVRRTIELKTHEKTYVLNEKTATLMVRPRGWHLPENHVLQDGEPIVGALLDFGLFVY